jgi:hypothetical protein
VKFETTILQTGTNTTGIAVPSEVVEALGAGKKPAVSVTVNGHTYRSSIASMGGTFMISLSAENRAAAGVAGGDTVEVDLDLDTAPREVDVPDDLAAALAAVPEAKAFFESLSYSNKRRHVMQIDAAKTAETRQRRIQKAVALFAEGKS